MELFETPPQNKPEALTLPAIPRWLDPAGTTTDAFYAAVYAQMSCLPIKGEISRFLEKVNNAENRAAAARIAGDRGDPDTLTVLEAARKVQVEVHRITGFLRFAPDSQGVYTAKCEPDYFILPALAEHFTLRFGETPWAIIDEKRGLCLCRQKDGDARIVPVSPDTLAENGNGDCWGELWRLYHRSVSNESRKNPRLQRQFMPKRYHKHLNEL